MNNDALNALGGLLAEAMEDINLQVHITMCDCMMMMSTGPIVTANGTLGLTDEKCEQCGEPLRLYKQTTPPVIVDTEQGSMLGRGIARVTAPEPEPEPTPTEGG